MIDICIVTHNKLNFLRIFCDYLFSHTKDFKLFISDSGSTDKTLGYLEKLKEKYPDIVTYRHTEDNSGWCKGINWGVSQGSSPYVLIANEDIILPENWFEKMKAHLREDVGAVGPISDMVSGRQQTSYSYGQYEDEVDLLIGFCILTKREILDKVGVFDENYTCGHDDYDLSIRLRDAGYKLIIARDVFVKHFCYDSLSQIEVREPELFKHGKDYTIAKHGEGKYRIAKSIKPTVIVAIPFNGDVSDEFVSSLISMRQPGGTGSVIFAKSVRTLITPARNLLAQAAVDYDSQFLLFIDSDMVFGEMSLIRLIQRALDPNVSIVGGLCFKRREPYEPCIMKRDGRKWKYCTITEPPGLYEVDGIGMGFTLIKTKVLKDLKKPYFYSDKDGLREDLNFCLEAKKAGHRIFVDTTVQIGHLGERAVVDYSFVNNLKKEN